MLEQSDSTSQDAAKLAIPFFVQFLSEFSNPNDLEVNSGGPGNPKTGTATGGPNTPGDNDTD